MQKSDSSKENDKGVGREDKKGVNKRQSAWEGGEWAEQEGGGKLCFS